MTPTAPRLDRERKTMSVMIDIYCKEQHASQGELCPECAALEAYAMQRVDKCPFGPDKPTCAKCPIHCYKPDRREQVRQVMRFAGPRMIWKHPVLAVLHIVDGHLHVHTEKPPRK